MYVYRIFIQYVPLYLELAFDDLPCHFHDLGSRYVQFYLMTLYFSRLNSFVYVYEDFFIVPAVYRCRWNWFWRIFLLLLIICSCSSFLLSRACWGIHSISCQNNQRYTCGKCWSHVRHLISTTLSYFDHQGSIHCCALLVLQTVPPSTACQFCVGRLLIDSYNMMTLILILTFYMYFC